MNSLVSGSFLLAAALCSGCSSSSTNPTNSGECTDISGTWEVTGDCGPDSCDVTQNGCSTDFSCTGAVGYTGTVSGSSVSWHGTTSTGVPGKCTGTVSGSSMSGTCTVTGGTCNFSATKQ